LFLVVDEGSEFSKLMDFRIVRLGVVDMIKSNDMFGGVGTTIIKLRPLIVDSNLSLGSDFVLGLGTHVGIVLLATGDS
jgi:hypothetical protein